MGFLKDVSEIVGGAISVPIALVGGAVSYTYNRIDGKDHDKASDIAGDTIGSITERGMHIGGEIGPTVINTLIGMGVSILVKNGQSGQTNNNPKKLS